MRGSCTVVESSGITVQCRCSEQGLFAVLASSARYYLKSESPKPGGGGLSTFLVSFSVTQLLQSFKVKTLRYARGSLAVGNSYKEYADGRAKVTADEERGSTLHVD